MARIILGSYMVRYPLGGMMSWVLQYLVGFQRLGHDIYFVEKAGYPDSCYDPARNVMSDDCSCGTAAVHALLDRFGLGEKWCFVDAAGRYHGLTRKIIEAAFRGADLFIDMGTHGSWEAEALGARQRVLIDGEPGFTQMKMMLRLSAGERLPAYDHYFTTGRNLGSPNCSAPTAGRRWKPIFHPVVMDLFHSQAAPQQAPFTTVMNWQSHQPVQFEGRLFGQKDLEFPKFADLPTRTRVPLELAVSGKNVPSQQLREAGWRLQDAHEVTATFDTFEQYVHESRGEFSVCKNVFVETGTGWFSDRSAVYLACGRPVVMQDTGFSAHLPCGEGLFAVKTAAEAADAIAAIQGDYERHSRAARAIACECLDAGKVFRKFLDELGL
jgi:hypothetical protein